MPPAVLDGRIVKASKGKRGPTNCKAIVKRQNWLQLLGKYSNEIQYFHFQSGYNREDVSEIMERMFKIGATQKDYRYFLDQPEFKKNLKEEEWNMLAPYYFASSALDLKVAVEKQNGYIIEPSAVQKGVCRFPRPKETVPGSGPIEPGRPYALGTLTVFNPDSVVPYKPIPKSIISKLPCGVLFQFLVGACLNTSRETGQSFGGLLNSSTFRYLWEILYHVSNNRLSGSEIDQILDDATRGQPPSEQFKSRLVEEDELPSEPSGHEGSVMASSGVFGLRRYLKGILSMDAMSVVCFAENLLPLLILRRDEDMISHIFRTHSADTLTLRWYTGLLEIDTKRALGYFFKTDEDPGYFYQKYSREQSGLAYCLSDWKRDQYGLDYMKLVRQILIQGIENYLPMALTAEEAAALLGYTLYDGNIALDLLQVLFPLTTTLSSIEEQYEILYGTSVLDIGTRFNLKDLLAFGFRRNIHILALEAVIENKFEKASLLLPCTKLGLTDRQIQDLCIGAFSSSYGNVWDILGKERLSELLDRAEEEARDPTCKRNYFRLQDILSISFHLLNYDLLSLCLDIIKTHRKFHGRELGSMLMETMHTVDLHKSALRIDEVQRSDGSPEAGRNRVEKARLFHELLNDEFRRNGERYGISSSISLEKQLHSAIWARDHSSTRYLIELGAKVNEPNSLGEVAIITAIIKDRDGEFDQTDAELRDEVDTFVQLLTAKADVGRLEGFRIEVDDDLCQLDPDFLEAARNIDKAQITKLWSTRFTPVCDANTHSNGENFETNLDGNPEDSEICVQMPSIATHDTKLSIPGGFYRTKRPPSYWEIRPYPTTGELFSQSRRHIEGTVREVFLQQSPDSPQNHAKDIRLFLRGSRYWRAEDNFIIPNTFFGRSITLLQYLVAFGDIRLLEYFFQLHPQEASSQISQEYLDSPSPLQLAAAFNNLEGVIFLVNNGSDPREAVCRKSWPVHTYCKSFGTGGIINLGGKNTALHHAVVRGNLEMAQYLVEHGASIHERNQAPSQDSVVHSRKPEYRWGRPEHGELSALELAIVLGRRDCVALFLISDKSAKSHALQVANTYRQRDMIAFIQDTWGTDEPPVPRPQILEKSRTDSCTATARRGPRKILPRV
ncbi:hypothetical protein TWF481_011519 [Arthrobotrys musiformis]|uniref:Clr5 domain-containing protein n=1 Tax=Arthrobotrys musiformis TaxID=47236 RepID=A0AAV9W0P0_9PEZI